MENNPPTWKDSTIYHRDDNERIPSSWTYDNGKITITITRNHLYYPDNWVLHCRNAGLNTAVLRQPPVDCDPAKAQEAAILIVKRRLMEMAESL